MSTTTLPSSNVNLKPTAATAATPRATAVSPRRVQLVILCCILFTLASFAATVLGGQAKPIVITVGLPLLSVVSFLALSWTVARSKHKAFGVLMLVSVCLYGAVLIVFSQGHLVTKVIGESMPGWVWWVCVCLVLMLHGWFAQVLYEYAIALRGGGQQGSKHDMAAIV